MLIYLTDYLTRFYSGFNVFNYLTFRAILGALTSGENVTAANDDFDPFADEGDQTKTSDAFASTDDDDPFAATSDDDPFSDDAGDQVLDGNKKNDTEDPFGGEDEDPFGDLSDDPFGSLEQAEDDQQADAAADEDVDPFADDDF